MKRTKYNFNSLKHKLAASLEDKGYTLCFHDDDLCTVFLVVDRNYTSEDDVLKIFKTEGIGLWSVTPGQFATKSWVKDGYYCDIAGYIK